MMNLISNRAATPTHPASTAAPPEEYITKEEVARRLKKTARTIENWQRQGYIPFVKTGHSVIYKWSDVEAHLQANFRICRLAK